MPCQLSNCLIWDSPSRRFLPSDSVPVTDRGFRYGMSVFETVLVVDGFPVLLTEHLNSLVAASASAALQLPEAATEAIPAALGQLQADFTGVARLYLTAGDGAPDAPAVTGRLIILLQARALPTSAAPQFTLASSPIPYSATLGGLKTANYWENIRQIQWARTHTVDEAVLFNPAGEIVSCAMANLFLVRDDKLLTPPLASGARQGIVRAWLIEHYDVAETPLDACELSSAEALMVTSSWLGVRPVSQVDTQPLAPSPLVEAIATAYLHDVLPGA